MGLLERLRQADVPEETLEEKTAHDALEKIEDRISQISPFRVIFASITAFLVLSASVIALVWLVPYDRVSVDVIYKQAGSSHIVLSEINNQGSRAIESVSLDLVFIDSEDIEPIYKTFDGWTSSTNSCKDYDSLEENFKDYIRFIEDKVGVKIKLISLGPDREETIYIN